MQMNGFRPGWIRGFQRGRCSSGSEKRWEKDTGFPGRRKIIGNIHLAAQAKPEDIGRSRGVRVRESPLFQDEINDELIRFCRGDGAAPERAGGAAGKDLITREQIEAEIS